MPLRSPHEHLTARRLFARASHLQFIANTHQTGEIIVRAGAATTAPNEDSGNLKLDGAKVAGTKSTLDSDTEATMDGPPALSVGRTRVSVDVDPWVYMVGIGYKL